MGVDAGAWIVTLFEASGYRSPPSQASLFSPKWRKHYDARFGSTFADVANIVQSRRSKTERGFRPFVDLYDAAERVKQGYRARNREDLCAMSIDITYGYHADSEHCATCPRASACALTTADAARAGGAL